MSALLSPPIAAAGVCPVHEPAAMAWSAQSGLAPDDWLELPLHQRAFVQYGENDDGERELRVFYGDKEISFDEPELFTFGETLVRQPRFRAGDALDWGRPGDWSRVRGLLEQLIEAGVLHLGDEAVAGARMSGEAGARPSPLPPAPNDRPRSWHECPGLMQELTGRPLDIAHLELVVPIFRVAHMTRDTELRQVGESNAFPPPMRLEVPTRWRTCIYGGSRHLDDKPMNVSALKAMRAHWAPAMALLLKVREAYLARCPAARAGWTVGHLERLSTAVLALPAYQLMRRERRVADGELHPVLSTAFRVTDGLRMTMHHMLFSPFGEPTRHPDTPMSAAEVHEYAERSFSLHSEHGVCAGPKAMIEEFLAVIIDGEAPRDGLPEAFDPGLRAAFDDIEPALDYALLGLQAYAAVFSLWPVSMRTYERLHAIAVEWAAAQPSGAAPALVQWLDPLVERLRGTTHLATEAWRADREVVYGDMYAQTGLALDGRWPARTLAESLAEWEAPGDAKAERALRAALRRRVGGEVGSDAAVRCRTAWIACLMQYFRQARAVVRTAVAVQARTNRLLGREAPTQPFRAGDIDLYVQLVGQTEGRVPFLLDELDRIFAMHIDIDADGIAIHDTTVPAAADTVSRSIDTVSTNLRA